MNKDRSTFCTHTGMIAFEDTLHNVVPEYSGDGYYELILHRKYIKLLLNSQLF